jgi:aspartate aminotransferase
MKKANLDKEYLPITGLPEFTRAAAKLAYGVDSVPLTRDSVSRKHSHHIILFSEF